MARLPLGPIEAFVVVARTSNLARAADLMHLTVPALSRRIQLLEQHLGVAVFERLPRGLRLTEAGAAYFAALAPGWDGITAATEAAQRPVRRHSVRISVMPTFAANWLVPRFGRFHAGHGGIAVELETSADLVDLQARRDLDGAIRLGRGGWAGLACQKLLPVAAFPVASARFLGQHRPFRTPRDLLGQTLVGSNHQRAFWQEWFEAAGIAPEGCRWHCFDNLQLVHEAAAAHMGIAIGLDPLVRPYLEDGRLVRLFPSGVTLSRSFYLVQRLGDGAPTGAFAVFRDWLLQEAQAYVAAG